MSSELDYFLCFLAVAESSHGNAGLSEAQQLFQQQLQARTKHIQKNIPL